MTSRNFMPPGFRFAPSPNGYLHLGHAFAALLKADKAKAAGGRMLLRIEDSDEPRCRPEYETAIYEDLAWLGLRWEEPVWRQSQHYADYQAALGRLQTMGLTYRAYESRTEIARAAIGHDPDGAPLFPGRHNTLLSTAERTHRIDTGKPYAVRLDVAAALKRVGPLLWTETGTGPSGESGAVAANPAAWGYVIIARKETPTSYHLAVVVDDARQGVTDVVRGQDLFASTSVHALLQQLGALPQPRYRPHRLIHDEAGQRLSKSTQSTGLRELRASGATPAEIRRIV